MHQMNVFDTGCFVSRSHCGSGWTQDMIWASAAPALGLFVLYTFIAVTKFVVWRHVRNYRKYHRESDVPPVWFVPFTGLFFFGCALGHLNDALVFVWPAYYWFAAVSWYTLIVSLIGTFGLVQFIVRFIVIFREREKYRLANIRTIREIKAALSKTAETPPVREVLPDPAFRDLVARLVLAANIDPQQIAP